nr:phosphate acyltransferase PlsX [uncultured Bilophila sp.]
MAVQQNKKSHSKKGMRRSHDRVSVPTVVYCTCGAPTVPHAACPSCGTYRGRQVVPPMSSNKTVIAVDAMGGDLGPSVVIPGAIEAARQTGAKIILVGNEAILDGELTKLAPSGVDLEIVHAPEVAGMDEKPSDILRRKKNASIQVACRLVRDGAANGVVSAGHSGASVACGMFIMGRIPGVERPALASLLPTEKEPVVLLDVGATVDCKPYNIFQFGLMGNAFARDILNKESPRVGLLSIGEEEGKGNSQVKEAYELFKMAQNLNFTGNIEGRDLFTGDVDVAVCDGFVGNVALKLSEGLGMSLSRVLKRELLSSGILPKLGSLLAKSAFRRFAKVVDYAEYGGAPLLGLQGISIVCHGRSNAKAICSATRMAVLFVEKETNRRLMEAICANEELTRYGRSC